MLGENKESAPSVKFLLSHLRIWEFEIFWHQTYHPVEFDNFKHFSFSIQEKILWEFKMCLQLARLQGGLYSWVVMKARFGLWNERYKRLKIPYDVFPKYALIKNQVLEDFSHFFVAIFSLIFIGHLYQHLLFLSSFILNHTSRLSSCKIILLLGCIIKFSTW